MPKAKIVKPRGQLDPDLKFGHGVRKDGTPWISYSHPECPNVVRLALPNHPDFERVRIAFFDSEDALSGAPIEPVPA